jgi:hypothetical protein
VGQGGHELIGGAHGVVEQAEHDRDPPAVQGNG